MRAQERGLRGKKQERGEGSVPFLWEIVRRIKVFEKTKGKRDIFKHYFPTSIPFKGRVQGKVIMKGKPLEMLYSTG